MSGHRQFTLLLWVLCAAAVTLSANRVRAQCRHGAGSNPGISPGMLQQTVMQQQQLLQQQQMQLQLLQRVRQQQLLQTAQRNRQMRDLADKGPEALKAALRDPKPEMRQLAALTVGKYGPALTDELIELLTDDIASVRQAARRSLIRLNTSAGRRNVDFGPAEGANRVAQKSSARQWRSWLEQQQAKADNLKAGTAKAPTLPPKIPLLAAEASAALPGKKRIDEPADRRDGVPSKQGGQ